MMLELRRAGHLSLEQIVEKAAHNPARLFGIDGRGFIREGYFADFAIVDLEAEQRVTRGSVLYKCGWSPLEGETLHSRILMTILGGEIVFRDGKVHAEPRGQALRFNEAAR
jgi:dihydroorotase